MTLQEAIENVNTLVETLNWQNTDHTNKVLKILFSLYHKFKDKFPYKAMLDKVQNLYPKEVNKHFGYRMDTRTLGDFGLHIYEGHLLERRIANFWFENYAQKHFGDVTNQCVGIDDTGSLLLQTQSKEAMKRPDYLIQPKNIYLEIKSNPCDWKYTPKVADIEHYVSLNAYVLAVCSNGKFQEDGRNCSCYFLISPEQSRRMLELGSVARRPESGHKPAVQFYWNLHEESVHNKMRFGSLDKNALPLEAICEVHWVD